MIYRALHLYSFYIDAGMRFLLQLLVCFNDNSEMTTCVHMIVSQELGIFSLENEGEIT